MPTRVIYFDFASYQLTTASGKRLDFLPPLAYDIIETWEIHVVDTSSGSVVAVDLSAYTAFTMLINDFLNSGDVYVLVEDTDIDKTQRNLGILTITIDTTDSSVIYNLVGNKPSINAFSFLVGYNVSAERRSLFRIPIVVLNTQTNGDPPDPTPASDFYTAVQVDALLNNKQNFITTATENNIASFDSYGGVKDSSITAANVSTAITNNHTHSNKAQIDLVTDGDHDVRTDNPHATTKTHVGLGSVSNDAQLKIASNLSDLNSASTARTNLGLGDSATKNVGVIAGTIAAGDHAHAGVYEPANANIQSHISSTSNPHSTTKTHVGLSNVQNTKVKLDGTTAPITTDDTAAGYSVGSLWADVTNDNVYICIDSTTSAAVWRKVNNTGMYNTVWIDAGYMVSRTTSGASPGTKEYVTNDIMSDYFDFDADTDEAVQFKMGMSDKWDRGTIKAKIYWTNGTTAGTGDVVFGVRGGAVSDDDPIDAALGTAQTVTDTFIAEDDLHISAASAITIGGTPALADMLFMEIYRDADNVADTYTQDARLLGIMIQYKELTTEPSIW